MPNPPKYEGPFEDADEEEAAYSRWKRLRDREKAEEAEAARLEEEERKKKKGRLLPIVS